MSASPERPGPPGPPPSGPTPPDPAAPAQPAASRPPSTARHCANCDAPLYGEFCAQCGQRSTEIAVSLRELAKEFADEYLSLDSRLLRSVLYLFFRPGFLTRQYLIGRRERYVRPLRLYLVSSLAFFFALSLVARPALRMGGETDASVRELIEAQLSDEPELQGVVGDTAGAAAVEDTLVVDAPERAPAASPARPEFGDLPVVRVGGRDLFSRERLERLGRMRPQELIEAFVAGLERQLPRMMFVLMPVFAFILTLLNYRRPWFYAEHFIFTLHFHAFAFALFLLLLVLPSGPWNRWLMLWGAVYLFLAMRVVYRQPLWKVGVKFMLLGGIYSFLLLLAVVAAIVLTLLLV